MKELKNITTLKKEIDRIREKGTSLNIEFLVDNLMETFSNIKLKEKSTSGVVKKEKDGTYRHVWDNHLLVSNGKNKYIVEIEWEIADGENDDLDYIVLGEVYNAKDCFKLC